MKNEEQIIQQQAEEIISRLKGMSSTELNELYEKFKQEMTNLDTEIFSANTGIINANEKMKDRDVNDDSIHKIIFSSCLASVMGGATLGGVFGQGAIDFVGGAMLGAAFGTIFIGLLATWIYGSKPVAKVVQGIRKYALERKVNKLENKKQVYEYLQSVMENNQNNEQDVKNL